MKNEPLFMYGIDGVTKAIVGILSENAPSVYLYGSAVLGDFRFGWLLDISRCIYTLRTGRIIAKTKAGEWALENGLCPDPAALTTALRVRKEPQLFDRNEALQHYAENLGDVIRAYADVLGKEIGDSSND